jgi:site-specific recombinase XerD
MIAIEAFKERAPNLCNIPLSEVEELTDGFQKYIEGRMRYGVKDSTIRRELNPLRHMFKMYGKRFKLHVDPFHDLDIPPEPLGRERWLRPEEDLLLYKAIEEQCRTEKLRLRWLCLVFLALSTALRRGVFLNLKWEDIDWERQTITIKKTYWAGKKKAPDKVPMTFITENTLKMYYQQLSDSEKEPTCKLFPGTESGFNSTWNRIIKRSELSNLHFHDLRHTAVTRYEQLEPIQLSPRECNYLLGKGIGVRTGVEGYSHVEFLNSIRKKLDAADDISRTLDPDISDDSPVQPMMPDAIAYTRAMLRIYKRDQFGNPVTLPLPPMITPKGWLELKAKGIELTPEEPKKEHQWKPGELHIKLSPKG